MLEESRSEDRVAVWESCLQDVARHRYRTRIQINLLSPGDEATARHEPCD